MKRQEDDHPEPLLERMGRSVVPVLPSEREAALQVRAAASVDRLLNDAAAKHSPSRGRIAGFLAAAAAIAVIGLAGASLLRSQQRAPATAAHVVSSIGRVAITRGAEAPISVSEGDALAPGDELTTAVGAHANLSLADRAALDVSPETRLRVASKAEDYAKKEMLELVQGQISFNVPKLEPGSTLSVRTADAVVIVRGTRFSVGVERGSGVSSVTRVSVEEGRVEVQSHGRTVFLGHGERWSSAEQADIEKPRSGTAEAKGPKPGNENAPAAAATSRKDGGNDGHVIADSAPAAVAQPGVQKAPRALEKPSTLAEENQLYQSALRASQSGDSARALTLLESLLRQYPSSPLAQSARVEHFRVLLQMGNVALAAREARRYLSDYPSGFARAEARQIVLRGLGDAE
jgi:hypothetical protein